MPLKLVKPRKGKSPYYTMRGTYLGIYTDRSTGTGERALAQKILGKRRREIESGKIADPKAPGFAGAANTYMIAGGEERFLTPLIEHFKHTALADIDQAAIDHAADTLYPNASAATRNRQVYSPVSAVLKHAGLDKKLKRPKGWRGGRRTAWLEPDECFALLQAADALHARFGLLCFTLVYTGLRLSEALDLEWRNVQLDRAFIYVPDTKTGTPRAVHLTDENVKRLRAHHVEGTTGRVFRFHKGGRLYNLLAATEKAAKVTLPDRTSFHIFRHTYATWMRRYGGLDGIGLTRTGAWADLDSVDRYAHSEASEEAKRANLLPVPKRA